MATDEERTQETQIQEALESYEGEPDRSVDEGETEQPKDQGGQDSEVEEQPTETEETVEADERTELQKMQEELKRTREELQELREGRQDEEEEVEETTQAEPIEFFTQEEIEEGLDNPEQLVKKFNDTLNRIFNMSKEFALKEVPPVVTNSVNRTMTVNEKAKEFYKQHPELMKHKGFVGHLANKLSSEYDDVDKLFEATAEQAYKELNITKKARETENNRRKQPAFARKPNNSNRNKGVDDNRTDQQKQIDAMIDAVS